MSYIIIRLERTTFSSLTLHYGCS